MNDKTFNLPDLSNGDLSALLHGSAEQVSPFSKEIYIGRQSIVGMRFQGGAETLAGDLRPGDRITFLREPDNEYDKQAIMAMDSHGRKLGYIPQRENLVMSSLMDHGKVFFGRIPDISPKEYVYSRRYPKQMTESEIGIPVTITVDLYMREFPLSGDMTAIPRHGSDASYAVVSFRLTKGKPERIQHLCAIKVINGEERGLLDKRIPVECLTEDRTAGMPKQYDRNRETERIALNEFKEFIGLLPIVSHGMTGKGKRALEEAYGVLLGASLSNLLIDTEEMAQNHLPDEKDYKLDNLIRRLKIHVTGDSHAERCCRRTWELYRRMDKSELHKDAISSMGSAAEKLTNGDDGR